MICIICGKPIAEMEEPAVIKHLALELPFGQRDRSGHDIVNQLAHVDCVHTILEGVYHAGKEAAKMRETARERAAIQNAQNAEPYSDR